MENCKNELILSENAVAQLTSLKEHNWNLKDARLRELFGHVLYPRLDSSILSLVDEQDFSEYEYGRGDSLLLDVCDDIATIIFFVKRLNDTHIVYIDKFIWTFRQNDWFKELVEEYSNNFRKTLYEKIMNCISKIVKEQLRHYT